MNRELVITGLVTLTAICVLAAVAYGLIAMMLVLLGAFGMLMTCIGLEIRNPLDLESNKESN